MSLSSELNAPTGRGNPDAAAAVAAAGRSTPNPTPRMPSNNDATAGSSAKGDEQSRILPIYRQLFGI